MNKYKSLPGQQFEESKKKSNNVLRIFIGFVVILASIVIIGVSFEVTDIMKEGYERGVQDGLSQGGYETGFNEGVIDGRLQVVDYTSNTGKILIRLNGQIISQDISTVCSNLNVNGGVNNGVQGSQS